MARRRRKKIHPPSPRALVDQSYRDLAAILSLKKEHRHRKRDARLRTVVPLGPGTWEVSGGECDHVVTQEGVALVCDHEPHTRPVEGFACAHEIAVRRFLSAELLAAEIAA